MRSRNIKPGFFTSEELAECDFATRLCFEGLWLLADREGRLEDRPKRIKGELFRFDSVDVEAMLADLDRRGFILRYRNEAGRFIQILKFAEHQSPHYSEKSSVIMPPDFSESSPHINATDSGSTLGVEAVSRGGRNPLIPDSLIPDSGFLIPDSTPTPDGVGPARPSTNGHHHPAAELRSYKPPDCPHQAVLALWGEILPALPQHDPAHWGGIRADHLRARWRETAAAKRWERTDDGLAYLRKLFGYVGQSPFLTGRVKPREGKRPFVVELEWLVSPGNWARVHEGKYHEEVA